MAFISATDAFDEDDLEPEVLEDIRPFIDYCQENFQSVVNALQGNLGDINFSSIKRSVKAPVNTLVFVADSRRVSNVTVVQVLAQPESLVLCTGFNWWKVQGGFQICVNYTGDKLDREVVIKVEYNE